MISVTVTPSFTSDTLTFDLPDGPVSEAVVKALMESVTSRPGEIRQLRNIAVKVKTDGDFKL
jgi:hypothetical protein